MSRSSRALTGKETPDASNAPRSGKAFALSVLSVVRKALSASSVSYLETLQETEPIQEAPTTQPETQTGITRDIADYDLDEAIRRSILDAMGHGDCPQEIEMERFRTRPVWDDEGSSAGRMTPSDGTSSRMQPSSSSGVTYQDLYCIGSDEQLR